MLSIAEKPGIDWAKLSGRDRRAHADSERPKMPTHLLLAIGRSDVGPLLVYFVVTCFLAALAVRGMWNRLVVGSTAWPKLTYSQCLGVVMVVGILSWFGAFVVFLFHQQI